MTENDHRPGGTPTVLYDGDCGFCRASVDLGRRYLTRGAEIRWQPWQQTEGLSEPLRERARHEVLLLHPDGRRVWGGIDMIAVLMLNSPRHRWHPLGSLLLVPGVHEAGAAAYRWVSRNRGRLPAPPTGTG